MSFAPPLCEESRFPCRLDSDWDDQKRQTQGQIDGRRSARGQGVEGVNGSDRLIDRHRSGRGEGVKGVNGAERQVDRREVNHAQALACLFGKLPEPLTLNPKPPNNL